MSSFRRSHESDRVSAFRLCSKTWLLMKFLLSSMLLMFIVLVELVASIIFKVIGFVEDKDSLPVEEEFADLLICLNCGVHLCFTTMKATLVFIVVI